MLKRDRFDATTTTTSTRSYTFTVRAGHQALLPAAVQTLHDGVSCSWVLRFTVPGAHHATVTLAALGFQMGDGYLPMVFASPAGDDHYDRKSCQVTVQAGSDQYSCEPIPVP